MNVTYSEKTRQENEEGTLLQHATNILEDVLSATAYPVNAEWARTEDAEGQVHYALSLSDGADNSSGSFTLDDLRSPFEMRYRLHHLWEDLLRAKNYRQLENLQRMDDPES